jgi:Zn-dependent protease
MLGSLMLKPLTLLLNAIITLIALTGHEFAHGWVSTKLGDPTPRATGRLTLNPLAHLDIVGTILMILTGFGWAKPVGINPRYYKNMKKGTALTAAAGPLANLIMAFIAMLIYAIFFVLHYKIGFSATALSYIESFTTLFAFRNLCFMVFNIIPIPPLDGAKVLGMFLPDRAYYTMLQYERYSMLLIMLLSLSGAFSTIIGTGVNLVLNGIIKLLNVFVGMVL